MARATTERIEGTATPPAKRWFAAVCALAGGLAVPLQVPMTIISAAIAAVVGLLGLALWRWSRLPRDIRPENRRAPMWLGLGVVVGLLLLAIIRLVLEPFIPNMGARIGAAGTLPVWRRLLIIYVAAVGEELVFRLLLLSAVAGILVRVSRVSQATRGHVWIANTISALAFGGVHLFSWTSTSGAAAPFAAVALNLSAGLVLGYVFATRGIVAAMWTHAGGDCAIQLIGPLTG